MGFLIKGGRIFTAVDDYIGDIRLEGEKIVEIGRELSQNGDEVVDARGYYVFPGGIDTHTHFDLDVGSTVTADDFESGTKAALFGGTTVILDYAAQDRGETLMQALQKQHGKADGKCWCDYGFHMGITDWNDSVAGEMKQLVDDGVSSFKLYMAYKGKLQVDDGVIYEALKRSVEVGGLIGFHCENGDVIERLVQNALKNGMKAPVNHALTRPAELEAEAVDRVLHLAAMAKAPVYVVHLSTEMGLCRILAARERGLEVYAETCPQYLLLEDSLYGGSDTGLEGAKYVMSPPLRKVQDQTALWKALSNGNIQTTGTDHCSFNYKGQKELGLQDFTKIPNGGPGVEHRMELLYSYGVRRGILSIHQFIAATSTNAAKLFGMFPQKGTIAVGSDGDLVLFNPNENHVIQSEFQHQNVDYTPYEGYELNGRIQQVFLRGKLVVDKDRLTQEKPSGKYLKRGFCPGK